MSVWTVLVTVLGTILPRRSLPKGTHMFSPSTLGLVGVEGTLFQAVIFSSSRWWMMSADRVSTNEPGYRAAMERCSRSWLRRMAVSTRLLRHRGS